jgi:protein SCO1/2
MRRLVVATMLAFAVVSAFPAWSGEQPAPRNSIFQLDVPLSDQSGRVFALADRRGKPTLMSMFYTSCQFTCPTLVEAIRADVAALSPAERERLGVLLVSFDPARDTTAVLQKTAMERHVDPARWQLARTDSANVRKLAAMLDIPYRALPSGDFNHSAAIILVDGDGRVVGRTSNLSGADADFVKLIRSTLAESARGAAVRPA